MQDCVRSQRRIVREKERERERDRRRRNLVGRGSGAVGWGPIVLLNKRFFLYIFHRNASFRSRVCKNVRFRHFLSLPCSKMYRFCKQNTTLGPSPWLLAKTMKFATLRSLHRSRVIPQPLCFKPPPCGQAYYFSIHRCMCMCICVCLFSCVVWLHLACRCRIGASALR